MALRGTATPRPCLQVGDVGAVDGDDQRFARGDDVGRQPVEKVRPSCHSASDARPDAQQPLFAGPAFAVRGQHAAGHPRRAGVAGAVHAHRPAVERGAAGDRQADDAAADDGE